MGLDMYLKKEIYVGANFEHNNVTGVIDIKNNRGPIKVDFNKVSTITEIVGYWRKANAIHKWFVDNVQGGKDDCARYHVDYDKLLKLKNLCLEVLETKDPSKLPPQSGFFFGSTAIDDWYFDGLKHTVKVINELDPGGGYYYESSW